MKDGMQRDNWWDAQYTEGYGTTVLLNVFLCYLNMIQEIELEKGLSMEKTLGSNHSYWLHYNGHDPIKNSNIKLQTIK